MICWPCGEPTVLGADPSVRCLVCGALARDASSLSDHFDMRHHPYVCCATVLVGRPALLAHQRDAHGSRRAPRPQAPRAYRRLISGPRRGPAPRPDPPPELARGSMRLVTVHAPSVQCVALGWKPESVRWYEAGLADCAIAIRAGTAYAHARLCTEVRRALNDVAAEHGQRRLFQLEGAAPVQGSIVAVGVVAGVDRAHDPRGYFRHAIRFKQIYLLTRPVRRVRVYGRGLSTVDERDRHRILTALHSARGPPVLHLDDAARVAFARAVWPH